MHPSIIASSPSPLAIRRLKTSMYANSSPFFRFVPFFTPPPPRARSRSPIGEKRKTQHENRETPPGDRPKLTHGRQKISTSHCLPTRTRRFDPRCRAPVASAHARARPRRPPRARRRRARRPHTTARRSRAIGHVEHRARRGAPRAPRRAPRDARGARGAARRRRRRTSGVVVAARVVARATVAVQRARARTRTRIERGRGERGRARRGADATRRGRGREGAGRRRETTRRRGNVGGGAGTARGRGAADATTEDSRGAERGIAGRRRRGMG